MQGKSVGTVTIQLLFELDNCLPDAASFWGGRTIGSLSQ
jgi:hypothetical protein